MENHTDPTRETIERRLSEAERNADEDRLRMLEELHSELESALAEVEVDQAGPPGR
jgi:hypothetical protein